MASFLDDNFAGMLINADLKTRTASPGGQWALDASTLTGAAQSTGTSPNYIVGTTLPAALYTVPAAPPSPEYRVTATLNLLSAAGMVGPVVHATGGHFYGGMLDCTGATPRWIITSDFPPGVTGPATGSVLAVGTYSASQLPVGGAADVCLWVRPIGPSVPASQKMEIHLVVNGVEVAYAEDGSNPADFTNGLAGLAFASSVGSPTTGIQVSHVVAAPPSFATATLGNVSDWIRRQLVRKGVIGSLNQSTITLTQAPFPYAGFPLAGVSPAKQSDRPEYYEGAGRYLNAHEDMIVVRITDWQFRDQADQDTFALVGGGTGANATDLYTLTSRAKNALQGTFPASPVGDYITPEPLRALTEVSAPETYPKAPDMRFCECVLAAIVQPNLDAID